MNKWLVGLILSTFFFIGIVYSSNVHSLPTIKYFPIDEELSFQSVKTKLELLPENNSDSAKITWTCNSITDEVLYLRQDVSLLYKNGKFKGLQSKWEENTTSINLKETFPSNKESLYQAISFHHGEIHDDEQIKSIQQMSSDELYVDAPSTALKEKINQETQNELLQNWDYLANSLKIDLDSYVAVPLIDLNQYNNKSLPSLTKEQTDKIIGQLWEGLYKNYIIPLAQNKENKNPHYIPLVLFDKQKTHLIVIYELFGKKEKLIQQY